MPCTLNYKKVAKTIKIFAVAQLGMVAMLIYMAILFQQKLQAIGRTDSFVNAVIATFVIQMVCFYPIYKFSSKESERDLALTATNLGKDEIKVFSKKKRYSDIIKFSVFCFYAMFILQVPSTPQTAGSTLVLSVLYFSFIMTVLTYLQCYNFAAKKLMKQNSAPKA